MRMVNLGYARLSRQSQAEGDTLNNHKERLERIPCDHIFVDLQSGWKGKSDDSADRDGFQKLIKLSKELREKDLPVNIYFGRVDRWGRSAVTNVLKIEELENIGCKLYSLDTGRASTKTAGDWLNISQQSLIAEYYSRQLSDNIGTAYQRKRQLNKPLSSRPPMGYKLSDDKSTYEFDDREYKNSGKSAYSIAVELIELYYSGSSSKQCAKYAVKYGCNFQSNSFNRWIKNPTLRGHLWYYDPPKNKAKKLNKKPKQVIIPNNHQPIITIEQWRVIETKLIDSNHLRGRNQNKTYPLQRLCKCAHCGGTLTRNKKTRGKYTWYCFRCTNVHCTTKSISTNKVEMEVIKAIQTKSAEIQSTYAKPTEKVKPSELIQLESHRDEIKAMYDRTPLEGLKIALTDIENQIAEIQSTEEPYVIDTEELKLLAEAILDTDAWKHTSDGSKRVIYQSLVDQVVIDLFEKSVEVYLLF